MEINLFAKCIKDLIAENDRVDVPHLGIFRAEQLPASYSNRKKSIDPPYRKVSFSKSNVAPADASLFLSKLAEETGLSEGQAAIEAGWLLGRINSMLELGEKCVLPGLGVLKPGYSITFEKGLDISPDSLGLERVPTDQKTGWF